MVTLARIIYASRMVDAIDPARLDRLPADVRAAFEAQAKALAETSGALDQERSARRRFELETSQLVAEKSNLAAENAFLKEANLRLKHLVHELRRARFGPRSEKLNHTAYAWHAARWRDGLLKASPAERPGRCSGPFLIQTRSKVGLLGYCMRSAFTGK